MSKSPLRVLQLIDSLNAGGSERMAVQIANQLTTKIDFSGLVSTRKGGILEKHIDINVNYNCLNKNNTIDLKAFKKLHTYVKKNRINIIHAHSTSFFLASLIKTFLPSIKLVWHDHYGYRYKTSRKENKILNFCSSKFDHIICINNKLKVWAEENLNCKYVSHIENFSIKPQKTETGDNLLQGERDAYKIVHVANLRPEKDHLTALKAIKILLDKGFNLSYHSIGSSVINTTYTSKVLTFIADNKLEKSVFLYGSQSDVYSFLNAADLGILTSTSEGFPVSLVEYAMAGLPVVTTDVGDCKNIIGENGEIVNLGDQISISNAIERHISNPEQSESEAKCLNEKVEKLFNKSLITNKIIDIYTSLLSN